MRVQRVLPLISGLLFAHSLSCQVDIVDPDTLEQGVNVPCMIRTGAIAAVGAGVTFYYLDRAWYAEYERAPMHSFNDNGEWLQMDKAGHFFNSYTISRWGHALLSRCNTRDGSATLWGAGAGLAFLTGVEILDGTSAAWGFSWGDMDANLAGVSAFAGQQLTWGEQRIAVKLSTHPTRYAEMRPDLLGKDLVEQVLKDYNGHTVWLSGNIQSLTGLNTPAWLNLAAGYGATGMISAFPRPWLDGTPDPRERQYFISPDIDFTRIRSGKPLVRTLLFLLNSVKMPAPTIEFRGRGRVIGHLIYF